jgi:hypothetical protein
MFLLNVSILPCVMKIPNLHKMHFCRAINIFVLSIAIQKCKSKDEASIVGALSTIKHLLPRFCTSLSRSVSAFKTVCANFYDLCS